MWGKSPPVDFHREISEFLHNIGNHEPLEVLTVGACDARHIIKTLASSYVHPERKINFHVIEFCTEYTARSILQLNISLQKKLGLQEASRYYLEIFGNTLLTPGTTKFLIQITSRLINVITQTIPCPWLQLEHLKYKERDLIEAILKFWIRASCEGLPIVQHWDRRVRKALGTRYDYREGVFDWDYQMVLKSRNLPHLTAQEYRFWRNCGIAYTWLETEPSRSNPTLISNIVPRGNGFYHHAYLGDITNGPYLTWALDGNDENGKLRATDKAEGQVIKAIYQIRERKLCPDSVIAAHRDKSLLNGTLVTEMPNADIEQECWTLNKNHFDHDDDLSWIDIPQTKVTFHSVSNYERFKSKNEWQGKIDVIFVAHNMINEIPNIAPLLKKGAVVIVESCKFLVETRKETQEEFGDKVQKLVTDHDLKPLRPFNPQQDIFARFVKE